MVCNFNFSIDMQRLTPHGNMTQLAFCRDNVDPDVVTRRLGLMPSESTKIGETAEHLNGLPYKSQLGTWKLNLPNADQGQPIEEQIGHWISLLQHKTPALKQLRDMGYTSYLDCRSEAGSLSLCIEPIHLTALGEMGVSPSIWLFEQR